MTQPDDEDLLLYFYGEHPDRDALERALDADPSLRARLERLRRELGALDALEPVAPRDGLEQRLWARLAPRLEPARRRRRGLLALARPAPGYLLAAAAAALLIAVGFLAGRWSRSGAGAPATLATAPAALSAPARDRALATALGRHLDASERLLVELANDGGSAHDQELRFAESLLASNRLYRRAAERAGHRRAAVLLAELEPLLVELANAPSAGDGGVAAARERLEADDLLFKVRVTRSNI